MTVKSIIMTYLVIDAISVHNKPYVTGDKLDIYEGDEAIAEQLLGLGVIADPDSGALPATAVTPEVDVAELQRRAEAAEAQLDEAKVRIQALEAHAADIENELANAHAALAASAPDNASGDNSSPDTGGADTAGDAARAKGRAAKAK